MTQKKATKNKKIRFYEIPNQIKSGVIVNYVDSKENRKYIRGEFIRKKCKTAILLYCFHTAGILHIFMLYNLLGPGISFHTDSMPFTLQTMIFRYNYKSNDPLFT